MTEPGLVYQPDHASDAAAKLLVQFADSASVHALVRAHVQPLQDLEVAALQVRDAFDVDTAIGAQLTILGDLVGEPRMGRTDIPYRAYVKARILINTSKGLPADIYAIVRALIGNTPTVLLAREAGIPAHYNLDIVGTTLVFPWDDASEAPPDVVAKAIGDALEAATSGGVSFMIYFQFSPYAFEFASGDVEEDDTDRGFAIDDDELDDGGTFIGVEGRE
jgi:hypothetical protein